VAAAEKRQQYRKTQLAKKKAQTEQMVLNNLPEGVTVDSDYRSQEEASEVLHDATECIGSSDGDVVKVSGFKINIDVITNEGLIKMRKLLPQESYRLMKNRKSARICRQRKK
jgi:hypothetical protein